MGAVITKNVEIQFSNHDKGFGLNTTGKLKYLRDCENEFLGSQFELKREKKEVSPFSFPS